MEAASRVAKNTGILYARMAITMFISLYATRLVLAALGVADFGLFNVVGGVIAMLGFLNSSMAAATQRFMSFAQGAGDLEKVKRIFNMSTLLHWGIAIVILLLLEIAGYFFFNGVLNIAPERLGVAKIIYQFMVLSTLFTVISVPYEAVITSHENMMVYAILGIIEAVLKLGIALYITYTSQDHLVAYGFLMAALSIFLLVLRRIYCHRYYAECVLQLRYYYDKPLFKEMSGFAGFSLLGASSSMIAFYGQSLLINMFFTTTVNAAQAIAVQLSGMLGVFSLTITQVLNPLINKSEGAGDRAKMIKATLFGTKISFFLLSFIYVPFIIEMPILLRLWIKNVPDFSIIFCRLLLINNLMVVLTVNLHNANIAVGNIKKLQQIKSILNISPIILSYFFFKFGFVPYYLYISVIIFTVLHFFNTVVFSKINFELSVPYFLKEIVLKCLIVLFFSVTFSIIPLFLFNDEVIKLITVFVFGVFSFLCSTWFFGLSYEEKNLIVNLKNALFSKVSNLKIKFSKLSNIVRKA